MRAGHLTETGTPLGHAELLLGFLGHLAGIRRHLLLAEDAGSPPQDRFGEANSFVYIGRGNLFKMSRITGFYRVRGKRTGIANFRRKRDSVLLQEANKRLKVVNKRKFYALEEENCLESFLC